MKTNFIKVKIHNTQQNKKSRFYGDKDETINHISESSKLTQKDNKTRHDWVGKVISWELRKRSKFYHGIRTNQNLS